MDRNHPTDLRSELETLWEARGVNAADLITDTGGTLARRTARGPGGEAPAVDLDA